MNRDEKFAGFDPATGDDSSAYVEITKLPDDAFKLERILYVLPVPKELSGNLEDAQELMARARQIASGDPYVHYIDALILVQLGNYAMAISKLETAVETGYPLALMAVEPHLRSLESEPRFQTLIDK